MGGVQIENIKQNGSSWNRREILTLTRQGLGILVAISTNETFSFPHCHRYSSERKDSRDGVNGRGGGGSSPSTLPHGTMSSSRLQDLPDRHPLPTVTNHAKNGRRATILTIVPYSSSMRGVACNGISSRDACARVSFFLPRIKAPEPGTVIQHPHLSPRPAAREFTDNSRWNSREQNPNLGWPSPRRTCAGNLLMMMTDDLAPSRRCCGRQQRGTATLATIGATKDKEVNIGKFARDLRTLGKSLQQIDQPITTRNRQLKCIQFAQLGVCMQRRQKTLL